mmetsp:Transcript_2531/g.7604  ORF Transcript_2531/g.7604 Transcript_2531/m.7604 type:complete len:251 (+) Transcript_2531:1129-1881(+)
MTFKGAGEGDGGYWNKGISACAVCDGAAPLFRKKPLAVIGGGDSAMEEANFLTKYGSKVYLIHRRDEFRASKIMQNRAMNNPKIEILYSTIAEEAYGSEKGLLAGLKIRDIKSDKVRDLEVSGLFFAIGHEPATKFLDGQLELTDEKYIVTTPGETTTSVEGVFAAGDVQDKKWRQAVTAAGSGCMAALQAEHFLAAHEQLPDRVPERAIAEDDAETAKVVEATEKSGTEAVTINGENAAEKAAQHPVPS